MDEILLQKFGDAAERDADKAYLDGIREGEARERAKFEERLENLRAEVNQAFMITETHADRIKRNALLRALHLMEGK